MRNSLQLVEAAQSAFLIWASERWKEYSDRSISIAYCDTVQDIRGFSHQEGPPSYPLIILATAGIQLDTDRGGLSSRFRTRHIGSNYARQRGYLANLTPVKVGVGLAFRSDSSADVMQFITMVYSAAPGPGLMLQDENGTTFQCRVTFPADLDFPVQSEDDGKYFLMELSVVINCWVGEIKEVGLIKHIKVFTSITDKEPTATLERDENGAYPVSMARVISYSDRFDKTNPNYVGTS